MCPGLAGRIALRHICRGARRDQPLRRVEVKSLASESIRSAIHRELTAVCYPVPRVLVFPHRTPGIFLRYVRPSLSHPGKPPTAAFVHTSCLAFNLFNNLRDGKALAGSTVERLVTGAQLLPRALLRGTLAQRHHNHGREKDSSDESGHSTNVKHRRQNVATSDRPPKAGASDDEQSSRVRRETEYPSALEESQEHTARPAPWRAPLDPEDVRSSRTAPRHATRALDYRLQEEGA